MSMLRHCGPGRPISTGRRCRWPPAYMASARRARRPAGRPRRRCPTWRRRCRPRWARWARGSASAAGLVRQAAGAYEAADARLRPAPQPGRLMDATTRRTVHVQARARRLPEVRARRAGRRRCAARGPTARQPTRRRMARAGRLMIDLCAAVGGRSRRRGGRSAPPGAGWSRSVERRRAALVTAAGGLGAAWKSAAGLAAAGHVTRLGDAAARGARGVPRGRPGAGRSTPPRSCGPRAALRGRGGPDRDRPSRPGRRRPTRLCQARVDRRARGRPTRPTRIRRGAGWRDRCSAEAAARAAARSPPLAPSGAGRLAGDGASAGGTV